MEFIGYYSERRPISLEDKRRSWLMKLVNWVLVVTTKMGVTNIKDFMGGYVTTIGRRIYASPPWTLKTGTKPIVVHELTHIEQWGLWYALTYIFSSKLRMRAESACVQAEMMCFPERFPGGIEVSQKARHFVPYGVSYEEAFLQLKERWEEARLGRPKPAARKVYELFSQWKTEYPNGYK